MIRIIAILMLLCTSAVADSGVASHYGKGDHLHGSKVACPGYGRFNAYGYTAAHRRYPCGTKLVVTHRGKSVDVVVTDRGPFHRGRVLDLAYGAARAIGLTGTGRVEFHAR